MNKKLTQKELDDIMSQTIFMPKAVSFTGLLNECSDLCKNIIGLFFCNWKQNFADRQYINNIIKTNNVEHLVPKFKLLRGISMFDNYESLVQSHPFLKEISEKTKATEKKNNSFCGSFISYVGGNCWVNAKLSNELELNNLDRELVYEINKLVEDVEPLSHPVSLFHGFENYSDYRMVGRELNMKGFLSKSLSFNIASGFAISKNYFRPNFLVVNYPIGSKHIHPNFRIANEEMEYLTKTDEKLVVTDIKKYYSFPRLLTFYVCEPQISSSFPPNPNQKFQ